MERKCSPEFLIAGNASSCCMSFGQPNAITYALEPGFGIINIYYKDRIIANSVIWINQPYNCLVLDNIEVHPNYQKFSKHIRNLFEKTIIYLLERHKLNYAVQGSKFNDLILYNEEIDPIPFKIINPLMVTSSRIYTDAHFIYPLRYGMPEEEIIKELQIKPII